MNLLDILIFLPILSVILIAILPAQFAKVAALLSAGVTLVLAFVLYQSVDIGNTEFQMVSRYHWFGYFDSGIKQWVSAVDIKYMVGVDGVSVLFLFLTALLFPLSIGFTRERQQNNPKLYYALLMILETALMGVFASMDVVLFYVFFEMTLIPVYFLIGIWGGKDRYQASIKYLVYTLFGSLIMLLSILYLGYAGGNLVNGGVFTSDYLKLRNAALPLSTQNWLFIGFALGFAVKSPLFPFHTWIADTYANTSVGAMLVGLLIKIGVYGFIRYTLPLLPLASVSYAPVMCILATIAIVYGAVLAMKQPDMKRLLAYSSVSHIGFIILGIFSMNEDALAGSLLQLLNYSISTGALFLCVGMLAIRHEQKSVLIFDYQGVAKIMPVFTFFFMIAALSSIGLPGLNGFVGEFLILLGSFNSNVVAIRPYVIVSATGVVFAAIYMLYMFKKVMFGKAESETVKGLKDISWKERLILTPLVILMIWIGFKPNTFLSRIEPVSNGIVQQVKHANSKSVADKTVVYEPKKP